MSLQSHGRKRSSLIPKSADSSTRQRAVARRLAELERENYHEVVKIEVPSLDVLLDPKLRRESRTGATTATRKILGSRKALGNLLDDDPVGAQVFLDAGAAPSRYPPIHLCSICGYWGKAVCIRCGARYCSIACEQTHQETRCLKVYA